ncbi:MAG: hypothetical protein VYD08_07460 [Pseudomonadota bacterium]|nr:hypothetical protein [Pseudomonadota bacterium]
MSKTELQNIYTTRIACANTDATREDGTAITINYQVDLLSVLDNTPGEPGYDPEIPIRSGVKIRVSYRTPASPVNKSFFTTKEQAEYFIEELSDPNSSLYAPI